MKINRIIEVDMNTDDNPSVRVRIVKNHKIRGYIPHEEDLKQDITVLVYGLLSQILQAEKLGVVKKGEAMKYAIKELNEAYLDGSIEAFKFLEDA